jgi:hypothetical protein
LYHFQVADVLWHNLQDIKDGLIEMLAATTFDGNFGLAHDFTDFGGDILGVTDWDTSYANKWSDLLLLFISNICIVSIYLTYLQKYDFFSRTRKL